MGRLHSTLNAVLPTLDVSEIEKRLLVERDPAERCNLLTELGTLRYRMKPEEAHGYYQSALTEAERTGRKRMIAHALFRLAVSTPRRGDMKGALAYLEQARRMYMQLRDRLRMSEVAVQIARIHADDGNMEAALPLFTKSLEIFERAGEEIHIFDTLWAMAGAKRRVSDIPGAIEAMHRAEILCRMRSDELRLSLCHNEFGLLYRRIRDYDSALRHLFAALEIRMRKAESLPLGVTISNIGGTYLLTKQPQEALPYLLKAQSIYASIGESYREANVWNGLAEAHDQLNELVEARRCLQQASKLLGDKARTDVAVSISTCLGWVLYRQKRYSQSLRTLRAALDVAVEMNMPNRAIELHEMLSTVHSAMGSYKDAFEEYVRHVELRDRVMGTTVQRSVAEIEKRFAVAQKERDLNQAASRVQELEDELRAHRMELTTSTLRLVQRGSMIRKLAERMNEPATASAIGDDGAGVADEWSSVVKRIAPADGGLHERLLERFPMLTPTEVKVACLIGSGLSSKEIASLLYVVERTVEIHRGSIRRKLGLGRGDSLAHFLGRLGS